jgi:hypothetical protein
VDVEHALGRVVVLLGERDAVGDGDAADHEDAVDVLDVADRFGFVALGIDLDSARLQRARVRAGQSAAGRGHHVIERRGARRDAPGRHPVVLGDLVVDPERDRLVRRRQIGEALRAALARDADTRYVRRICDLPNIPPPRRCRRRHHHGAKR